MKDLCQYGNRRDDEWEILPWIPDPRPSFKIWVKPEQIAPFFLIPHHPYQRGVFSRPFLRYLYAMVPYIITEEQLVQVLDTMKAWFAQMPEE